MVAIANEDAREAITDDILQSNSLRETVIESIVIILAALSRRNCAIFPLLL
jgi:hypothetical protein